MKKIVVVLLTIMYCVTILLNAELNVEISTQNHIDLPYDVDFIFLEEDVFIHFYDIVEQDANIEVYHYALNNDLNFTPYTLLESVNTQGSGIEDIEMKQVYGSDCIHLIYLNDSNKPERVTMISNFEQVQGSIDLSLVEHPIRKHISVSDSLFAYQAYSQTSSSSVYFKHNISTNESEVVTFRDGAPSLISMGDYIVIPGSFDNPSFQGYCFYSSQFELVNTVELNDYTEYSYMCLSDIDYKEIPYADGFITSFSDFGDPDNWPILYIRPLNNELEVSEIISGIFSSVKVTSNENIYSQVYMNYEYHLFHSVFGKSAG